MRVVVALALVGCGGGAVAPYVAVDRVAYPNGKARFEFELQDGVPSGRGRAWHANGKLASDGTYRDGGRHGRFWFYDEQGAFTAQAIFFDNAEVWRSPDPRAQPPDDWTQGVAFGARRPPEDATGVVDGPAASWAASSIAPRPYFSALDRTTAPARAGAQIGASEPKDLGFGAAMRLDVFGHYRLGRYGVFAQLSETRLALDDDMTLAGRRTAILAGTYHLTLGAATLSASGGLIVPLGNTDAAGSVASYAGAEQRTADAAAAIPAPLGVRSAASLTAARGRFVVQADTGVDWLLGGDERALDALLRANVGIGVGSRATMLTVELDNAIRASDPDVRLHTLALGGTLAFAATWLSASFAFSHTGTLSLMGTVGRDL